MELECGKLCGKVEWEYFYINKEEMGMGRGWDQGKMGLRRWIE